MSQTVSILVSGQLPLAPRRWIKCFFVENRELAQNTRLWQVLGPRVSFPKQKKKLHDVFVFEFLDETWWGENKEGWCSQLFT